MCEPNLIFVKRTIHKCNSKIDAIELLSEENDEGESS